MGRTRSRKERRKVASARSIVSGGHFRTHKGLCINQLAREQYFCLLSPMRPLKKA